MDEDRTRDRDGGRDAPRRDARPEAGRRGAEPSAGGSAGSRLLGGLLALLLLGASAGLYVGLTGGADGDAEGERGGPGSLSIRAEVVDFPTLDGDTASLADYRGRVVVLNLWGTWCPPCRREIPELVELQERIEPRGGTVVGLAVDSGEPASIREFAEEFGMNYPIWYGDGQEVVRHYRAMGFPTTYVIDREGVIRERHLGPQDAESLLEEVEPFLAEG